MLSASLSVLHGAMKKQKLCDGGGGCGSDVKVVKVMWDGYENLEGGGLNLELLGWI
jgi:hypothetical protein